MATTNQRNRSGGQKGSTSGEGGVQKAQQAASQVSHQVSQKMADMRHEAADYISQGSEQFGQMTRGHEGQAVLVALAAGFGVGFVIGCALVSGNRRPRGWRERMMAEGVGGKFLNRLERMLPDAITEHLGK